MGKKNKLKKFREVAQMPNVFQNFSFHEPQLVDNTNTNIDLRGKWKSDYFKNDNPITLELACGRGEYSVGLAQMFPDRNFIGIDIKGTRIWMGAKNALEQQLQNVAFIRTRIELVEHFFGQAEVDELWITFPDPFLKGNPNRRLTSSQFLERYRKICKPGAIINLKTDDPTLFDFTKEVIAEEKLELLAISEDIHKDGIAQNELSIKTYYEGLDISGSNVIKYLRFVL